MTRKPCPDREQLDHLLTNRLAETVREELERHVEDCAACQQMLEALTNATLWDLEPRTDRIPVPVNGNEHGVLVDPLKVTANATTSRGEPKVTGYEILGELGRGGMGVVYKAHHIRLNRPCALKMILAGAHAAPAEVARFLAEAEAIARLQHSHIVQIRHIGEAEGLPFFELEYVSGGSLDQQLDGTPWPAIRAARLAEHVALGIAEAHRLGIVHRDLKPANVLLTAEGTPKVSDFGLAKMLDSQSALTRSESVMGSPSYMAPEQAQGRAKEADPAVDVYAVGAVLYELLTGRPPFRGTTALETLEQVKTTEPVSPSQLVPGLPHDIETICLKCLQKDPGKRYAAAWALAEDLRRFQDGRPILARRIGGAERAWRWCRRNATVAGLTALAATLTVSITIVSTVAALTYRTSLSRAEKAEHEARLALGNSLVSEAAALRRTGLIGQRFDSLDRLARAAEVLGADPEGRKQLPEIRNRAIAALGLTDLRVRRKHDFGDTFDINVDAALERYAVAEKSGEIVVRRLNDDSELARLPGPHQNNFWYVSPAFGPAGELLVAVFRVSGNSADLLRVWHLGRRELIGSLPSSPSGFVFHPDGRRLLFGAMEGGIAVWDREERRVVRSLPLDFTPSVLALDAEGRQLAVGGTDGKAPRVTILDLETGRVLANWRSQVGASGLAWSADGQLLAIGTGKGDGRVYVWNVRREALSSVLQGHTDGIVGAQFAHSGYLLATSSWDGTTRLWDGVSGETLAMAPGTLRGGFSPDGRRLAFVVGGKLGVWEAAQGAECRTLHPGMLGNRSEAQDATVVHTADVSPDGRLVATGDRDGVRLSEAGTGRELAHLKAGHCDTVLFQPEGQRLITSSRWGLYRWPIRLDPGHGPDAIRIGPPELLREYAGSEWSNAAWMPDRQTLALIDNANARVLLVDSSHPHPASSRAVALGSGENERMTTVAVSPDGRWLAVGGWFERGVRVWDLRRRQLDRILSPKGAVPNTLFFIGFSPDGRWLISSTHAAGATSYHFWRVGTWELGLRIDQERNGFASHPPAFTGDGRLMALGIAPDQVLLADAATGRESARLTTLRPVTPTPLVFSPDGTKLIARTSEKTVLVWDLRRIRDQLAPGLDWDAPPYPTAPDSRDAVGAMPPLRAVRVVGEVMEPEARRAAEMAEINGRLVARPDDAEALIRRGWRFVQQKKWPEAIADLEQLLRLHPGDSDACWLLGEAYEEARKPAGALAAFSRLLERAPADREARFQRGLIALALARPGLAADDFSRILAAEPDLDRARYRRAQALIRLGRHREALADLDILIPKDPTDYALYELRGIVREAQGDHEQARADQDKAGSLLPEDPMALNSAWDHATGPIAHRDPERAIAQASRAFALAPGGQVGLILGWALYRAGRYAEAISFLDRGLATVPIGEGNTFTKFFLAMAHQKLGHVSQARACFDQAVRSGKQTKLSPGYFRELRGIHAEAEAVMAGSADVLPADVFSNPQQTQQNPER